MDSTRGRLFAAKRSLLSSPFKSPRKKKSCLTFSPNKCKRKVRTIMPSAHPKIIRSVTQSEDLAQPLKESNEPEDEVELIQRPVRKRRNKLFPASLITSKECISTVLTGNLQMSSKARNIDTISIASSRTQTAIVSPIKLKLQPCNGNGDGIRRDFDVFSAASSTTETAIVSPIKLRVQPPYRNDAFVILDHDYCADPLAAPSIKKAVTPLKIKWKPRDNLKAKASESSKEYFVVGMCGEEERNIPVVGTSEEANILDTRAVTESEYQPDPFVAVHLTVDDVPEAALPHSDLNKNTMAQLKKWLKFRNLPVANKKPELIRRVQNCMGMKRDTILDPKVDGGVYYKRKEQAMMLSQDPNRLDEDELFGIEGWDTFPSLDMPGSFTFGSIFYYLIETMPGMEDIQIQDGESDEDSGEEECDDIGEEIVEVNDPFQTDECAEIKCSKKLRRGLHYVKSGFLRKVQDNMNGRLHLYKAQVRASMKKDFYTVKIAISQASGTIVKCYCDKKCPQKALGRCSHISSLLLTLLIHKNLNGPQGELLAWLLVILPTGKD